MTRTPYSAFVENIMRSNPTYQVGKSARLAFQQRQVVRQPLRGRL